MTFESNKLFNSECTENFFAKMKQELHAASEVSILAICGKQRTGKSTAFNNIINQFINNQGEKKLFFEEKSSMIGVTNGADYCIIKDSSTNKHYVFIDCEGTGNYNSQEMLKLYLLVASISNTMIFNVEKAFEDQTFMTFINQIIVSFEVLNLPLPDFQIMIRDSGLKSLKNLLKINNLVNETILETLPELEIHDKAKHYLHSQFQHKSKLNPNFIHFISPPNTDDEANFITYDMNSKFMNNIIQFSKHLKEITKAININEFADKEKILHFIFEFNISKLTKNEIEGFTKGKIQTILDNSFNIVFNKSTHQTNKSSCMTFIESKKNILNNEISEKVKKILPFFTSKESNFISQELQRKTNEIIQQVNNAYTSQKNVYDRNRENSKYSQPVYTLTDLQEPYNELEYYHLGTFFSYCTNCGGLSTNQGCIVTARTHPGWNHHTKRVFGIKIKGWYACNTCGQGEGSAGCQFHYAHGNMVIQCSHCRQAEGSQGCGSKNKTLYRNVKKNVISSYQTLYSVNPWNENNFSIYI